MKIVKYIEILFCVVFFLNFGLSTYAQQVGVNTTAPTATLDVNGNFRLRKADMSTSSTDYNVVIDSIGVLKKSMTGASSFRGYLSADFSTSSTASIYKITNFIVIDDAGSDFNTSTNLFTAPFTGLYNISMTLTISLVNSAIVANNEVYGLVDSSTNKWVMRFSVPNSYFVPMGNNSGTGVANTFAGVVQLTKGTKYYFGITQNMKIVSNPIGSTGQGLGTYFAIGLVKRLD